MFGSTMTYPAERACARLCDAIQDGDAEPFEMDAYDLQTPAHFEDTTIGDVYASIDSNLWLAEAYSKHGAAGLARECARAAIAEFNRFSEIMAIYAGEPLAARIRVAASMLTFNN